VLGSLLVLFAVAAGAATEPSAAPPPTAVAQADVLKMPIPAHDPMINSGGQPWRELRNGPVKIAGGILVLAAIVAVAIVHRRTGGQRLKGAPSGRYILRFDGLERVAHWLAAISFVLLAVSGLVLLFGRNLLLPLIGYGSFSWLAGLSKNSHNFLGFVFLASVALMFFLFVRDNFWHPSDREWLRKRGGLFDHAHIPSGRFNAGEKLWFWGGMTALGALLIVTGLALDFTNLLPSPVYAQAANVLHGAGALVLIAASLGHIYMGTIGVEGAYQAMITGEVDESWAEQHHSLWYEEVREHSSTVRGARTGAGA